MSFLKKNVLAVLAGAALLAMPSIRDAALAQTLQPGDLPAKVTVAGRPLSAGADHVVAFTRGKTLYVNGQDMMEAVSGKIEQHADRYVVTSFPGMLQQKTVEFTIGSDKAIYDGRPMTMSAPAIRAYGLPFIPVSFFGTPPVRSKVTIAKDNRSANITLPKDMQ